MMRKPFPFILLILLLVGCGVPTRSEVIENNRLKDTQECRAKGGVEVRSAYNTASVCYAVDSIIPMTGMRETPPVG